jgi:DNA-binding NarL/FixJ family response regulator
VVLLRSIPYPFRCDMNPLGVAPRMQSLPRARVMVPKSKVFIVDDHPIVRRGLLELISEQPDLEVCGEAAELLDAIRRIKVSNPDLVIVDLSLQTGHGLELIEQIRLQGMDAKVLVFSMHDESLFAERILRAGATGFVNKHEPVERLLEGIHEVLNDRIVLSPAMQGRLLHTVLGGQTLEHDPIDGLSNRELQVFQMIGEGLPTKKIAVKLNLSRKTVEAHREKIKAKLNLANSAELGRRAVQWVLERR